MKARGWVGYAGLLVLVGSTACGVSSPSPNSGFSDASVANTNDIAGNVGDAEARAADASLVDQGDTAMPPDADAAPENDAAAGDTGDSLAGPEATDVTAQLDLSTPTDAPDQPDAPISVDAQAAPDTGPDSGAADSPDVAPAADTQASPDAEADSAAADTPDAAPAVDTQAFPDAGMDSVAADTPVAAPPDAAADSAAVPDTAADGSSGTAECLTDQDCANKVAPLCHVNKCEGATKKCVTVAAGDGSPCDDSLACSTASSCVSGGCTASAFLNCDDGNPCTDDSCVAQLGACDHAPISAGCDDANACTSKDSCVNGTCQGSAAPDCDDSNACTADTCDTLAGCVFKPLDSGACDDGNLCSLPDTCVGGACKASGQVNCNDANPCTADTCDPGTGKCKNQADFDGMVCDDGDACTAASVCSKGSCAGKSPITCSDGNSCTTDTCDAKTGCVIKPLANGAPCGGGDGCVVGETCNSGVCTGGTPKTCAADEYCKAGQCTPCPLFSVKVGGAFEDRFRGVHVRSNGYLATGYTTLSTNPTNTVGWLYQVKSSGTKNWEKHISMGEMTRIHASADADDKGTLVVGGEYRKIASAQYTSVAWLAWYDVNGAEKVNVVVLGKPARVLAVAADGNGGAYAAGETEDASLDKRHPFVVHVGADGGILWSDEWSNTKGAFLSVARAWDSKGGVVVAGWRNLDNTNKNEGFLARCDVYGSWMWTVSGIGFTEVRGVFSAFGHVYAVGTELLKGKYTTDVYNTFVVQDYYLSNGYEDQAFGAAGWPTDPKASNAWLNAAISSGTTTYVAVGAMVPSSGPLQLGLRSSGAELADPPIAHTAIGYPGAHASLHAVKHASAPTGFVMVGDLEYTNAGPADAWIVRTDIGTKTSCP